MDFDECPVGEENDLYRLSLAYTQESFEDTQPGAGTLRSVWAWGENVKWVLSVTPSIFGWRHRRTLAIASLTSRRRKDWWVSDVERVVWDLGREIERLVSGAQPSTLAAYLTKKPVASAKLVDEEEAMKTSAYEDVRSAVAGWSATKNLKIQRERTKPCETPPFARASDLILAARGDTPEVGPFPGEGTEKRPSHDLLGPDLAGGRINQGLDVVTQDRKAGVVGGGDPDCIALPVEIFQ